MPTYVLQEQAVGGIYNQNHYSARARQHVQQQLPGQREYRDVRNERGKAWPLHPMPDYE